MDSLFLKHLRHRANQRICILPRQRKKHLGQLPVRAYRTENLAVLHLPGHHRLLHAFALHQLDRFAQLAEAHPVQPFRNLLELRRSLFLQRDNRHLNTLAASALQDQERKSAVSRDQAPAGAASHCLWHEFPVSATSRCRVRPFPRTPPTLSHRQTSPCFFSSLPAPGRYFSSSASVHGTPSATP